MASLTIILHKAWWFGGADSAFWELEFPLNYWLVRLCRSDSSCTWWQHTCQSWCFVPWAPRRMFPHLSWRLNDTLLKNWLVKMMEHLLTDQIKKINLLCICYMFYKWLLVIIVLLGLVLVEKMEWGDSSLGIPFSFNYLNYKTNRIGIITYLKYYQFIWQLLRVKTKSNLILNKKTHCNTRHL